MTNPQTLNELLDGVMAQSQYLSVWEEIGVEDGVHVFQMLDDDGFIIKGTAEKNDREWFVVLNNGEKEQCITDSGEPLIDRVAMAAAGILDSRESL